MSRKIDLIDQRFGKLVVIEEVGKNKWNNVIWKCRCDCGNVKNVTSHDLRSGASQSCGCSHITHGMTKTRFYKIFLYINQRCGNKNSTNYSRYGGRGIKCPWSSFEEFYNDMYESYLKHCEEFGERNTSIDRIDNDGDYSKENCRWATKEEQDNNMRRSRFIEFNGIKLTIVQWSNRLGIKYDTLLARLNNGWDVEKALTTPIQKRR